MTADVKNSAATELCTARLTARGMSVMVWPTLRPSVQQTTPASMPGIRLLATTFITSTGPIDRATVDANPPGPAVLAPRRTATTYPLINEAAMKMTVRHNTDTIIATTRGTTR